MAIISESCNYLRYATRPLLLLSDRRGKPTMFYDRSISLLREKSRKRFRRDRPLINDQPDCRPPVFPYKPGYHTGTTATEMRVTDPLDRAPRGDKRSSCISDTAAVISDGETERITITNRFWCTINRASALLTLQILSALLGLFAKAIDSSCLMSVQTKQNNINAQLGHGYGRSRSHHVLCTLITV